MTTTIPNYILSVLADPKTSKSINDGFLTGAHYGAPAHISGYDGCSHRTPGCETSCLNTSGHGAFTSTQLARIGRTNYFFEHRDDFFALMIKEIQALNRKADRMGMLPCVRPNATSDLPWERIGFTYNGKRYANIMEYFPSVQFYDYTKVGKRFFAPLPSNYDLTFSRAETQENQAMAELLLSMGHNVAVVFGISNRGKVHTPVPRYAHISIGGKDYPVIDGDVSDLRFLDPKGHIVGLRMKGDAIGDTTGFVVRLEESLADTPTIRI